MASRGFRRPRRSFRSSRFAKKKLIWCSTGASIVEVAGTASAAILLSGSQWGENTSVGNLEHAKLLRVQLLIRATELVTIESRTFALAITDDQEGPHNPELAAQYAQFEPFHLGIVTVPGNTAVQGGQPTFTGYPDNVRNYKVNRRMRSDEVLNIFVSPATAAANQLSFSLLARCLVQLD